MSEPLPRRKRPYDRRSLRSLSIPRVNGLDLIVDLYNGMDRDDGIDGRRVSIRSAASGQIDIELGTAHMLARWIIQELPTAREHRARVVRSSKHAPWDACFCEPPAEHPRGMPYHCSTNDSFWDKEWE